MQIHQMQFLVNLKESQGQANDKLVLEKWFQLASQIKLQQQGSAPSESDIKRLADMFDHAVEASTRLYESNISTPNASYLFDEVCAVYRWLGHQQGYDDPYRLSLWQSWNPLI